MPQRRCDCGARASVFEALARAAGYRVRVWDAVENGDERDSFFWQLSGHASCASAENFDTEAHAWRDCCEQAGLLAAALSIAHEAGFFIVRNQGFIGCGWVGACGTRSESDYPTPADALIACVIENDLFVRPSDEGEVMLAQ